MPKIKHERGRGAYLEYSTSQTTGKRPTQQDAHKALLSETSKFAVLDGHGKRGGIVSAVLSESILEYDAVSSLHDHFLRLDEILKTDTFGVLRVTDLMDSGSTAVLVNIEAPDTADFYRTTVANCGDSRAYVFTTKEQKSTIAQTQIIDKHNNTWYVYTSKDHDALSPLEKLRIETADHIVSPSGRVDGCLMVSRAFGDIDYKDSEHPLTSAVIAVPEIFEYTLNRGSIVVLACDGLLEAFATYEKYELDGFRMKKEIFDYQALFNFFEENTIEQATKAIIESHKFYDNTTVTAIRLERASL